MRIAAFSQRDPFWPYGAGQEGNARVPVVQGRGEIVAMQQMVDGLQSSMRLLVASVRSPDDIVALASQACPYPHVHASPAAMTHLVQAQQPAAENHD